MPKSRNRPQHKEKIKAKNAKKLEIQRKIKEMEETLNSGKEPKTFTYHKDAKTVEVPISAWQMLNEAARFLQPVALFVSVMEQLGREHMQDGTLLPVYQEDLEVVPGAVNPQTGGPQYKIKDDFWKKNKETEVKKSPIIDQDGLPYAAKESPVKDLIAEDIGPRMKTTL